MAGRSLLLQGFGPQVYAAYQLLLLVDQEPELPEHEVRITKLVNASADELEVILKDILEDRARCWIASTAPAASPPAPGCLARNQAEPDGRAGAAGRHRVR